MVRYGMVIDLRRCIGCGSCAMACKVANGTPPGIFWLRLIYRELGKYPHARIDAIPINCMQCKEPACQKVCPTGATQIRDDGIVIIDDTKCVGCRFCMIACPYGVRFFLDKERTYFPGYKTPFEEVKYQRHKVGVVSKCDFCLERREKQKLNPACVDVCPCAARYFGDLDDPKSEVSKLIAQHRATQLRPELGTDPSVYYIMA
ncbi:MAG: 4Fe-4S dicluster domain-containing protein [Nitrososphaerota archaeon]